MNEDPHLLWITRDITDRKRMEAALRLSEDKFSKAFNASPISMSIASLVDGRITAFNDAFCGVLGTIVNKYWDGHLFSSLTKPADI